MRGGGNREVSAWSYNSSMVSASGVARGAMGAVAPLRFRRRKKGKIKLRVCMWSCRLSTISKVRLYKFVLYEENTGDYCQVDKHLTSLFKPGGQFQVEITCQKHAPNCTINNIKMQKAPTPPPPRSLPRRLFLRPLLKLNPGYATGFSR